ncbi:putative phosphatidate phosphatase [Amphibalanus amphitrite]|uniref:Putative phosphatidate phosphatase n=1 Tax=Amphibalanus amphitrite TaxID=1232801 RepID=A0A6A4WRZ1_AMPAM|nr:phospholipid phosphatase 1-like isoform X1 [Amphibalanus amphitrite]KAF0308039.1 putative phosphatidate phosphatase [Amphibalanus amphitrite]
MEDRPTTPLTMEERAEVKVRFDPSMTSSESSENSLGKQLWYKRLAKSSLPYARDFIFLMCAVAVVLVTRRLGPVAPGFFCHDPSITYPYKGDSVSVTVLLALTLLLPPVLIFPIELLQQRRGITWSFTRPLRTAVVLGARHCTCQSFLFALTEVIKSLVSRPRPSFLALCQPTNYSQTLCDNSHFISQFECGSLKPSTSHFEELLIVDSMLSFPSGHAATSCCTATFMALYLMARSGGGRRRSVLRSFLTFLCVLYGSIITFSRVADYRHHLTDALAGAALGTAAALMLCCCVCRTMFGKNDHRRPLLPQSSVTSNRTTDTQVTALEDEM